MLVCVPLLMAAGYGCQPSGGTTTDMAPVAAVDMTMSGVLKILSLGSNVTSLTQGGTVRVTAVVTHTSGIQKLLGGQLSGSNGKIKYGAFIAGAGGAYSLDLTWDQLHQAEAIGFDQQATRSFLAEFFDVDGNKVSGTLDLTLSCSGDPACNGKCLKAGAQCSAGSTLLCVAGSCSAGCYIGGALRAPSSTNPDPNFGSCQKCDPTGSLSNWTNATAGTNCGTGMACVANGACVKSFTTALGTGSSTFYDVWGSAVNDVWAVGSGTTAYRSTDSGKTWTATVPIAGTVATRYAVWGSANNNVYVVGASGTVVQTSNAGANWTVLPSPAPAQTLHGIWGSAATNIYVVGGNGTIARTTTNGLSWTIQTSGTTSFLENVWGSAVDNIFVVGDGGTLLRSTDSGTTWVKAQTNVTSNLFAIRGVAANDYYAGGSGGTVLRSTDGTTWTKLNFPSTSTVYDVWGSAANDVYVVTALGYIYRTTDSGQSWQQLNATTTPLYYGVWGSATTDIYAVGSSGYIVHHP